MFNMYMSTVIVHFLQDIVHVNSDCTFSTGLHSELWEGETGAQTQPLLCGEQLPGR